MIIWSKCSCELKKEEHFKEKMAESLKQEVNLSKRACWRSTSSTNNCNEKSTGAINNHNQNKCENNFSQFFNNQIKKGVNNCLISSIKFLRNGDIIKKSIKLNVSYSFNKIPVVLVLLGVLFYSSGLATARPNFDSVSSSDVSIFYLLFSLKSL